VTVATIQQSERDLAKIVFTLRQLAEGSIADSLLATAAAAPATPIASRGSIWLDSTDKRLHDKNDAGVIGTTVVADTGASNQFLTAISAAGAISKAQPNIGNLANIAAYSVLGNPTNASAAVAATAASVGWTPLLGFGGGSTGLTTSTATGSLIRIGPLVVANFRLILTAKGSSTGGATVTGLPYADTTGNGGLCSIQFFSNLAGLTGAPNGFIVSSTIVLYQSGAANSAVLLDTNFTNTTNLYGTCIYLAG
jgi:hypothetical protein